MREELGLDARVGLLLDVWPYHIFAGADVLVVTFGRHADDSAPLRLSAEHREVARFRLEEVPPLPMPDGYKRSILAWAGHPDRLGTRQAHAPRAFRETAGDAAAGLTLRTDRLVLAPLRPEHADQLFAIYDDPAVAFFARPGPIRLGDPERELTDPPPWREQNCFGVFLGDRLVGEVILRIQLGDGAGNLGYAIARASWGRGIATEAARAVMDYAFGTLGLAKVHARAGPRNVGSIRVMEKLGLRREGWLREPRRAPGRARRSRGVRHPARGVGRPDRGPGRVTRGDPPCVREHGTRSVGRITLHRKRDVWQGEAGVSDP